MAGRVISAARGITSADNQRCTTKIAAPERPCRLRSRGPAHSLDLASRAGRSHGLGAFDGGDGGDTQIVRGRPQPDAIGDGSSSRANDTRISPCPAALTLLGESSACRASVTCSPASAWRSPERNRLPSRDKVENAWPWKIGACTSKQRWRRRSPCRRSGRSASRMRCSIDCSVGEAISAVSRHHVERHLGIENVFGQLLERKQVHGLLVKFVHALLAMFRRRLEIRSRSRARWIAALRSSQQRAAPAPPPPDAP